MTVFGALRKGRRAAKEHNARRAEKQKLEAEKPPYRHVPTHAAIDALTGAPPSWRVDDRPRIIEANRRRSTMAHNGPLSPMGLTPLHITRRASSSLSQVSFPYAHADPVLHMPRNYSYGGGGVHPAWNDRGEVIYSPTGQLTASVKGKEAERAVMIDSGIASASSSKGLTPLPGLIALWMAR